MDISLPFLIAFVFLALFTVVMLFRVPLSEALDRVLDRRRHRRAHRDVEPLSGAYEEHGFIEGAMQNQNPEPRYANPLPKPTPDDPASEHLDAIAVDVPKKSLANPPRMLFPGDYKEHWYAVGMADGERKSRTRMDTLERRNDELTGENNVLRGEINRLKGELRRARGK